VGASDAEPFHGDTCWEWCARKLRGPDAVHGSTRKLARYMARLMYNATTPCGACNDTTVSGHHFSANGLDWHSSRIEPYTSKVAYTNGTTITVATRERPKLIFHPETAGEISHLSTGTCVATTCAPVPPVNCKTAFWDYTLVQPVGQTRA
jgi:hypothetical protein